ncbi:uncharacterized protein LOC136069904 [Quercus suber]|uniref:uncharacterized protein LOC136069904 n=1 Tax=Quercus suber TaxID=58331 RepID=UPI0032DF82E0
MKKYLEEVRRRIDTLQVTFVQIPREENECADRLAKAASAEVMMALNQVLSFIHNSSIINSRAEVQEINPEYDWTTPLTAYLKEGMLLDNKDAARKLKVRASQFIIINDVLYKRGFSRPYLRCLGHEEADYVMREVHEGICGNHSGARSLVHKLIRAGYYWPTMQKDAQAYVKTCDKCQRFGNLIRQPTEELTPMTAPWPFAQWELDIMGHLLTAARQLKFLVVGIDYFTKWVEAEALATITEKNIRSFVWRNIICRFRIPRDPARGAKGIWPDELPSILWAYRTTARTPTGETPFRLAYGSEAVILAEIGLTSYRVESYNEDKNKGALRLQLDLVDEVRATAEQRMAR